MRLRMLAALASLLCLEELSAAPLSIDVGDAIDRGVAFLRSEMDANPWWGGGDSDPEEGKEKRKGRGWGGRGGWGPGGVSHIMGQAAIEIYALVVSDVSVDDPLVAKGFEFLAKLEAVSVYGVSFYIMALDAAMEQLETDAALLAKGTAKKLAERRSQDLRRRMAEMARWLMLARISGRGVWNYGSDHAMSQNRYDNSNTQFAVLALGVAAKRGVTVPEKIWSEIAKHFLEDQVKEGLEANIKVAWPPGSADAPGRTTVEPPKVRVRGWPYQGGGPPTLNMTSAGLSSLIIAREYLARLEKLPEEDRLRIDAAIRDGVAYLAHERLQYLQEHLYYGLYSVEKVGDLGAMEKFGDIPWYQRGVDLLLKRQRDDGSWGNPRQNMERNFRFQTSFALLFLNRATDLLARARPIFTSNKAHEGQGGDWFYVPRLKGEVSLDRFFRRLKNRPQPDFLSLAESILAEAGKQDRLQDLAAPALRLSESANPKVRSFAQKCLEKATGEKHKDFEPYRGWLLAWRKATQAGQEKDASLRRELGEILGRTKSLPLKLQIVWAFERLQARESIGDLIAELEKGLPQDYEERVLRAMKFISGMELPFDVKGSAEARKEQLEKWRQWLQASGGLETPPAAGE